MNNEDNERDSAGTNDKSNIDNSDFIEDPATAVEIGTVTNTANWSSASADCLTSQPDSTYGTYNSSDKDDTITDDDIAFFLEDRPVTSNIPESCSHLYCVQPVPDAGINVQAACAVCNSTDENWICLTCYQVYCSRYVNKHMVEHTQDSKHTLTLSLRDVSVWCYSCDDYVYDEILQEVIKIVLDSKYGSPTEVLTTTTPVLK